MQSAMYHRIPASVAAIQLPDVDGDRAPVAEWLNDMFAGAEHGLVFDDAGAIEIVEGVKAEPHDWLVYAGEGALPMVYDAEMFAESFITAEDYETSYRASPVPPGFPAPPVLWAALSALTTHPGWPTKDHQMLGQYLVQLLAAQIPRGYVALQVETLFSLPREVYEQVREKFPNLPEMPSLITLDRSIGAAHQ